LEDEMPHYGVLGNYKFRESTGDIRGATVYGLNDQKLGKIDDIIFDHSSGNITYAIVDTGGWLKTKKFIVPADRLRVSTEHNHDFACDLSQQQIKSFPPYQESDLESEDKWRDYETRYRSRWVTGPVMHRGESDRNITPTTQQMLGNQSSLRAERREPEPASCSEAAQPEGRDRESLHAPSASTGRIVPAGTDSVVISNSAVGIGGRWDTFQARLRERRKEAVVGCTTCTVGPTSIKGSESAVTLKKAI
jgi:hypothetical protein